MDDANLTWVLRCQESIMGGGIKSSTVLHQRDTVVVQREEIGNLEVWLYSLSDAGVGDGSSSYMQSHLFGIELEESQLRSRSKETMKKAYLGATAKVESGI